MDVGSSDEFIVAVVSFVENIVAIGTCGNDGCFNSYNPSLFKLPCAESRTVPAADSATKAFLSEALVADVFPVGAVGRHLCSSYEQLALSLKEYIAFLFTISQQQFGCCRNTLIHCLYLIELLQRRNILFHQSAAVVLHKSCEVQRHCDLLARCGWHGGESTVSTDLSSMTGNAFASEGLSPSGTSSETGQRAPVLRHPTKRLCRACAQSDVFSLQMWNVQVFIAAALLLSMKVNEEALAEADGELLLDQFGRAVSCEAHALRCAERCVCESLWDKLQVTDEGLRSVTRMLSFHLG
ncbi:unnamed protein product [Trypanosoma congolense IL3000]|uniref:WGS project CAEQ00000000 data, annotated contig 2405 n=1 Tax=Trypanosoma congolense (strain IL3000) TaxID=1068625 RepID=F9WDU4_TRYCI|nr:unnamed protein product [Trypanosoma congolense IL3000]